MALSVSTGGGTSISPSGEQQYLVSGNRSLARKSLGSPGHSEGVHGYTKVVTELSARSLLSHVSCVKRHDRLDQAGGNTKILRSNMRGERVSTASSMQLRLSGWLSWTHTELSLPCCISFIEKDEVQMEARCCSWRPAQPR